MGTIGLSFVWETLVELRAELKIQREKANSCVVQVVQLEGPLERLSDCRTVETVEQKIRQPTTAQKMKKKASSDPFSVAPCIKVSCPKNTTIPD